MRWIKKRTGETTTIPQNFEFLIGLIVSFHADSTFFYRTFLMPSR